MLESVFHRPALHGRGRAPWPVGIRITLEVPVIHRIRIQNDGGGATFLCQENLRATENLAITDDHDFAAHIHA